MHAHTAKQDFTIIISNDDIDDINVIKQKTSTGNGEWSQNDTFLWLKHFIIYEQ